MNKIKNVYPIYLVREQSSWERIESSQTFLTADTDFSGKSVELKPDKHPISFQAHTKDDRFFLKLQYESVPRELNGEVTLIFDRKHSHRMRQNSVVFKIAPDGRLSYEEFHYNIERIDIPEGVEFKWHDNGDSCEAALSIPLCHLLLKSPDQRVIGFNAVRSLKRGEETVVIAWSGIPGERPLSGYGAGDLLLTRGLTSEEIDEWALKTAAISSQWYTEWEKWDIPDECFGFVKEKKRGFTIRLNREDVEEACHKADNTPWGRRMKEEIVKIADYWASKSDDELFDLVPVGNPRSLSVSQFFGDPIAGGKRTAYQVCLEKPYQHYNPSTEKWWYNGMIFHNPTTGEEIVLEDDGEGFLATEGFPHPGSRYMFTASYRLFILGMLLGGPYCEVLKDKAVCPETTGVENAGAINYLAYAYTLTGNRDYARKALILIGRIAELIPFMNGIYGSTYYDTVQIGEPTTTETHWMSNYFEAADLLHEVSFELDPELGRLFANKPDANNCPREFAFCVRTAILDMIPYLLFSCEIEKTRDNDWSFRWIYLELIIASYMESGKLLRHILYEGKFSIESKFLNDFFRDGRYIYDSHFYILFNCELLSMMANNAYRYQDDEFPQGVNLFENAQIGLNRVIELFVNLRSGALTPMFGDTHADNKEPISAERRKGIAPYSPAYEIIYRRAVSLRPIVGEVLSLYDQEDLERYRVNCLWGSLGKHALLLLATASEWEEYRQYSDNDRSKGNIQPSVLLQDSETSIFRAGTDSHNCKHVVLHGQPSAHHSHGDKLGLWIGGFGYHLLASGGRYPFTWRSPKHSAWETHSASCIVVVVDGKDQLESFSRQKCHYEGSMLQMAGLENTAAYPGTHAERWCLVIQAPDPADAYIVDLNYMSGGGTFDYNTAGMDCPPDRVEFAGIEAWTPLSGSLAGSEVPLYSQKGQGWMKAIQKAKVNSSASWTYPYGSASLKIHSVPGIAEREIIYCLGEKGGEEPYKSAWEPYVLWRDESADPSDHTAVFTAVIEPFEERAFIGSVQALTLENGTLHSRFQPTGIEITFAEGGYRDIVIGSYEEGETVRFRDSAGAVYETDARTLILRYQDNKLTRVEAVRFTRIIAGDVTWTAPSSSYRGEVVEVDAEACLIQVELKQVDPGLAEAWSGQAAVIDSPDYLKPSAYLLNEPQIAGNLLTFRSSIPLIKLEEGWPSPCKRLGLGDKRLIDYRGKRVHIDVKPGDSFMLANVLRYGTAK